MATQKIRINLASATFPLLTKAMGRTIVIPAPGGVEAAVRDTEGSSANYQKNTPQPLYIQNYLPSLEGLNSVKIDREVIINPFTDITLDKNINLYVLRDNLDTRVFYLSDPKNNYIYDYNVGHWQAFPIPIPPNRDPLTGKESVTVAYIKGKTYICIERYGVYTYNTKSQTFENVGELKGVDQYLIKGITSAGTYLILYTSTTIYWSNVNDPLDFVPSLITGAGSTEVLAVKSTIVVLAPVADGFIIYTAHNAVSAVITGDMNTPFTYKEIEDFTGLPSIAQLSYGSASSSHIAWTPTGIVEVNTQSILNSFPEATLFLQGKVMEEYDTVVNNITLQQSTDVLNGKFRVIGGRYIAISYSISEKSYFTHTLIFDIALKRWGKLAFDHIDVFEPSLPSPYRRVTCNQVPIACNSDTPNFDDLTTPLRLRRCHTFSDVTILYPDKDKTISMLGKDGSMHMVVFSNFFDYDNETNLTSPPFIIVGDLQLTRKAMTTLISLVLKTVGNNSVVTVDTYLTDSDVYASIAPPKSVINSVEYVMRQPGRNHRLKIKGNALLSTFMIEAVNMGDR